MRRGVPEAVSTRWAFRRIWRAACQAALLSVLIGSPPPTVRAESSETRATVEDVETLICGLGSVKDYERLRWILNAIDEQDAPTQANLLRALDERVDQLIGSGAESIVRSKERREDREGMSQEFEPSESGVAKPGVAAEEPQPVLGRIQRVSFEVTRNANEGITQHVEPANSAGADFQETVPLSGVLLKIRNAPGGTQ